MKWLLFVFIVFVSWRVLTFGIGFLGIQTISPQKNYLGGGWDNYQSQPWLWSWANYDGAHYLSIAKDNYFNYQQAFFPLYPLFIRFLNYFIHNYLISGLIISNLSFFICLILLYQLTLIEFSSKVAKYTLLALVIFPTSFYFGSLYTESLFLCFVLGSILAARQKKWLICGILGGLASATRITGVVLLPALLWEWYSQNYYQKKDFAPLASLALIPSGLLSYMFYLWQTTQDPLFFMHIQPKFAAQRSVESFILLPQVFWRYLKMIPSFQFQFAYFPTFLELFCAIFILVILVLAFKKIRPSYLIYAVIAYLVPTLTGTFLSLPRFALTIFPIFIVIGLVIAQSKLFRFIYLGICIIIGIIALILFTRGYWVA